MHVDIIARGRIDQYEYVSFLFTIRMKSFPNWSQFYFECIHYTNDVDDDDGEREREENKF